MGLTVERYHMLDIFSDCLFSFNNVDMTGEKNGSKQSRTAMKTFFKENHDFLCLSLLHFDMRVHGTLQ